ncbi:flagellar basal-body rod protein FlgF [Emcibacter sp.]|uniref:flagellar basal-body rod protein FlgF n=1 Tax=Emcibacter sp. TaxID=1979954 RepID=UPI003A94A671
MDTNIYVALSHQVAMRRQMDIIANNIANMNTTAFKRESVMFKEYIDEIDGDMPKSLKQVAFVQDYGISRKMTDGNYDTTGNPFDIGLSGDGLFKVRRENGEIAYTRNGHLALADDGTLVVSTGQPILDADDNPIQFPIPTNFTGVEIATDGTIWSKDRGTLGKLGVVTFADTSQLNKIGDNLFNTEQQPIAAENYSIIQGVAESSNVEPIVEITKMIEISRAYTSMAKMMEDTHKIEDQAINRLARLS